MVIRMLVQPEELGCQRITVYSSNIAPLPLGGLFFSVPCTLIPTVIGGRVSSPTCKILLSCLSPQKKE